MNRTILVIGIIFLLIGASVVSSNSLNKGKSQISAFKSNESQSISLINNDLVVTLETDKERYDIGEPIVVTILVTNTGEEDITVVFPTVQKADFWVNWGDVYLWSADKFFIDLLTPVEIPSGETVELFSENWEQVNYNGNQVSQGEYWIEGWMVWSSYNDYPIFSNQVTIIIGNRPPFAPTIRGKWAIREPGPYDYKFKAIDPDGDDVRYHIDWGDGSFEITDYYASGEEVIVTHTWNYIGHALVVAYAEDIHGAIGPEGYLDWRSKDNDEIEPVDTLKEIFTKIHIGVPEGASYTVEKSDMGFLFRHVEIWCEESFDISGYYLDSFIPRYFSVTVHHIVAPRCFVYFEGNQFPGLIGIHALAIGNIEWS